MRFDIITILPEAFDSYLNASLLARAQAKELIEINVHNLRDWASDPHKTVDDRPYGGGAGMVLKVDILARALKELAPRKSKKMRIIHLSPQGAVFTQQKAIELGRQYNHLVFICGRYEGFDARIEALIDEEISIGDYVLTGGELPALVVLDTVARLVPSVVGKEESLQEESFAGDAALLEYPHYTRPEVFKWKGKTHSVPDVLKSGNHQKIAEWRKQEALEKTKKTRPDLLEK